jgi:hypothetical protein
MTRNWQEIVTPKDRLHIIGQQIHYLAYWHVLRIRGVERTTGMPDHTDVTEAASELMPSDDLREGWLRPLNAAEVMDEAGPGVACSLRAASERSVFRGFLVAVPASLALWAGLVWLIVQTFR